MLAVILVCSHFAFGEDDAAPVKPPKAPAEYRNIKDTPPPPIPEPPKAPVKFLRLPLKLNDEGFFPPGGDTNRNGKNIVLNGKIIQIIDDLNMIVGLYELDVSEVGKVEGKLGLKEERQTVWLSGMLTKGLVDGAAFSFKPENAYKVSDTKRYTTALGGSKTVFLLENK